MSNAVHKPNLARDTERWLAAAHQRAVAEQLEVTLEMVLDHFWKNPTAKTMSADEAAALQKIIVYSAQHPTMPRIHLINAFVIRILDRSAVWIPMSTDAQTRYALAAILLQGSVYEWRLAMQAPDRIVRKWRNLHEPKPSRFRTIRSAWVGLFQKHTEEAPSAAPKSLTVNDLAKILFGDVWVDLYATDLAAAPEDIALVVLRMQPPFVWDKTKPHPAAQGLPADLTDIQF